MKEFGVCVKTRRRAGGGATGFIVPASLPRPIIEATMVFSQIEFSHQPRSKLAFTGRVPIDPRAVAWLGSARKVK